MSDEQILKLMEKLNDIDKRSVKMETLMQEWSADVKDIRQLLREYDKRIDKLESHKDTVVGAKDVITWLAIAGIMVWEVLAR